MSSRDSCGDRGATQRALASSRSPSSSPRSKLLAALVMVGKPIQVDPLSLIKEEDILARVFTPAPAKLNATVKLFINGEGFPIRIFPDLGRSGSGSSRPPPPPASKPDSHSDQREGDEGTEDEEHWKRRKGNSDTTSNLDGKSSASGPKTAQAFLPITIPPLLPGTRVVSPASAGPKLKKKAGVKPSRINTQHLSAPPKLQVDPSREPINEYGSNLTDAAEISEVLSPSAKQTGLNKTPTSNSPSSISTQEECSSENGERVKLPYYSPCKASKLPEADRKEVGWESPDEWAFENETLAVRSAKLKCNKLFSSPEVATSSATQAATLKSSKAKRGGTNASSTPASSTCCTSHGKGKDAESVFQKAVRRAAEKDGSAVESAIQI